MAKHVVGRAGEIPPGGRKIVEVEGRSIGVFNVNGAFYALRNRCPHQLAPLCRGQITGTTLPSQPGEYKWARDGEIIRCPWHGWEFDITNGQSIFNPHRMRVRAYKVTVEAPQAEDGPETKDPSVESYRVEVADGLVIVHV
jgi:3-phenylpropionate/trans-cinnamate dioxygenase ferredoxin subunit